MEVYPISNRTTSSDDHPNYVSTSQELTPRFGLRNGRLVTMGRWAAAQIHAKPLEAAQKGAHQLQKMANSPRYQAEQRGDMYSFEGTPEPVHPRSALPEEQAQHNISQTQFQPVFRTAQGIKDDYQGLSGDRKWVPTGVGTQQRPENHDEFWGRKHDEIADTVVARSLDFQGVRNPIALRAPGVEGHIKTERPEILGGHHRVAYMAAVRPNRLVPVQNFGNVAEAKDRLGKRY